jgi:hypothetical protein
MSKDLKYWIDEIVKPRPELGNFPVCPYAKGVTFEVVDTNGDDIAPPPWNFDLIVYVLPDELSILELTNLAKKYNDEYKSLIFLPDHKDRKTFIKNIQTSNGKYNLLLCQYRDDLNKARDKLKGTIYYSFWEEDYIKEIFET